MFRRSLVTALAFLLTGISLPGQNAPLGVVIQSSGGHLNNTTASEGTTVFDGDRLFTEAGGILTLRSGLVQLTLAGDSVLFMSHNSAGLIAALDRGSVAFRVENGGTLNINAVDVHVRPQSSSPSAGQVTLEECSVLVTSRVQPLEVSAGKETKIVEEGKSYRVLIGGTCGNRSNQKPLPPGKGRFLLVPVVIGVVTVIGVHEALESPDRP